ncbi:MAG: TAT-variant-translocated molybdopterin oxidoreductase [Chlorobi bacterium]|nr:TAT-variant-translocated molybdopterin oxidoreductase [Chlorobiota bacterium]
MKKYWRSLEEYELVRKNETPEPEPEFSVEGLTADEIKNKYKANRRDFLKLLGFSTAFAVAATSCRQPVRKAIPYLIRPENITPGVANYYATVMNDGYTYGSFLVKVRDGRPIKIEPNDLTDYPGTNAIMQASVLDLYDTARLQHPLKNGKKASWKTVINEIKAKLDELSAANEKVYFISSTVNSPSFNKILESFKEKYPNVEFVFADPVDYTALRTAHKNLFGKEVIPSYAFDKAKVIVGINADFLGTWLSPVEFSGQYAKGRDLTGGKKDMSRHYQVESLMSLTGTNADKRIIIKPAQELKFVAKLYNEIAKATGNAPVNAPKCDKDVSAIAKDLLNNKGQSLVVSGTNDTGIQTLVAGINKMLDNYGKTLNTERPFLVYQGDDRKLSEAFQNIRNGQAGGVLFHNINPFYEYPLDDKTKQAVKKLKLSAAFADRLDETAQNVTYVLANSHYLEAWGDARPYADTFQLQQPVINKLWDTKHPAEVLMQILQIPGDYQAYVQKYWEENLYPNAAGYADFNEFWVKSLQNGIFKATLSQQTGTENTEGETATANLTEEPVTGGFAYINANQDKLLQFNKPQGDELVIYQKVHIQSGKYANNPWLQELPDPVTKVVWDNYVSVSPQYAKEKGLQQEDVVKVKAGNVEVELPVVIQPGQDSSTIGIAMGYGRKGVGPIGDGIGKAVTGFTGLKDGLRQYTRIPVSVEKTGKTYSIASTQTHHTMEGRDIVRETTLENWKKDPAHGNEKHQFYLKNLKHLTLYKYGYDPEKYPGHHWGMAIDLNKCTGCSACIVACQVENNIAIVGKEEVKKKRIMHWLRIDRYYAQEENELHSPIQENPEVVHQPVMCQHCDNAPCENVCPVAATPHTNEGLNSMAYNRCIGTRYCMNNCPYKVRRFNWYNFVEGGDYNYLFNDDVKRMVLNPDVVVRQRGVVEKCTMCIQRIQEGKLRAKIEGRPLKDGEIKLACEQACPTGAITFGDTNDPNARVIKLFDDPRAYGLLEELHTLPSVVYLTKVRNNDHVAFDYSIENHGEGHHAEGEHHTNA